MLLCWDADVRINKCSESWRADEVRKQPATANEA